MPLTIEQKQVAPGATVLQLKGKVSIGRESQQLEWTIEDLLKRGAKRVVFDLSKLEYIDSTGVGIVALCAGKLNQAGGALRLAAPQGIVQQVFKVVRIETVVPVLPTVEEALKNLTQSPPS